MIGTIGTAPRDEVILSGGMGKHCGNVDAEEVCPGSTIYLPVEVEGALLSLGDCHAVQSDGELASVEMRSDVTLSCEVIRGRSPAMRGFGSRRPSCMVAVAVGRPLEEALWHAFRELIGMGDRADWDVEPGCLRRDRGDRLGATGAGAGGVVFDAGWGAESDGWDRVMRSR